MKILFCANVYRHVTSFHMPYLKLFREKGYEVWVIAANDDETSKYIIEQEGFKCIDLLLSRSPISYKNLLNYKRIKKY